MHHLHKKKQRLYTLFVVCTAVTSFLTIFLVMFIATNWAAFKNEVTYAYSSAFTQPLSNPKQTNPSMPSQPIHIQEPAHIVISKIHVDAPIQWNIAADKIIDALSHGVAHLDGSAKLGETGNVVIFGHSSDYIWKNNPYAAVFSLLPKLRVGDTIDIKENGQVFTYTVANTEIVNPNQIEVTYQTTSPVLTLITCYPIGTSQQRLVIQAKLTSPTMTKQLPKAPASKTLPVIQFR